MQLLLAALVFLIVALVGIGIMVFAGSAPSGDIVRGRLEAIERGAAFTKDNSNLNLGLIRDELMSTIPAFNKLLVRWSWPGRLRAFVGQAGMEIKPGKFVLICGALGVAGLELVEIIYGNLLAAIGAAVGAFLLPLAVVAIKRARRMAAFEKGFPEVIDLLARSARAGHAFTSGLEIVSTDLQDPVSTEFRIVFDEQRFGLPIREALLGLCHRVPLVDVRLFVIALLVQKETGGNLAEVLDNLSRVIRERFRIAGDVRVRTAQGRLTAVVLMALPLVMLVLLHSIDPEYVDELFLNRLGQYMLAGAAVMQVIGGIIIWRIVQIKV
jgi:tight adherence protein B